VLKLLHYYSITLKLEKKRISHNLTKKELQPQKRRLMMPGKLVAQVIFLDLSFILNQVITHT